MPATKPALRKGDLVEVYFDWLSCFRLEGKATLVRYLGDAAGAPEGIVGERWKVRFDDEEGLYERIIAIVAKK